MQKKQKELLLIYLNEFNLEFLNKGAKKYNCPSIKEVLKLKKFRLILKIKHKTWI